MADLARRTATFLCTLGLAACGDPGALAPAGDDAAPDAAPPGDAGAERPHAQPVEYVGLSVERPGLSTPDLMAILDPLFGEAAQAGRLHRDFELQPGLTLSAAIDPRTSDQVVAEVRMTPSPPAREVPRTITRVPLSFAYGRVFIDTVKVALDTANEVYARQPDAARPFHLEYQVQSPSGGALLLRVDWDAGQTTLTVSTQEPTTSLRPGAVNAAALDGAPYETVSGTVWFDLRRDSFAFFSNRAYGVTSGAAQNFHDFELVPHTWLRLTVTPRFEDRLVDVGFDVIAADGRRVPFARAPASVVAGDQFQQNVFRLVDEMSAQEQARPGSSTPWTVPFYYDDPAGGGVVQVIASGRAGRFRIAYAVQTPAHPLRDVEFLPYQSDVRIPDHSPVPTMPTCAQVGSAEALSGRFRATITASDTVRQSMAQHGPLRGPVWFRIYHAADVSLTGPRDGAEAVGAFHLDDVDLSDPAHAPTYDVPVDLPAGAYQILGFMDTNANADPAHATPDPGDPVTLPIGAYTLECASQPITIELALLLPPGR
jgi:hypothetical protein